MHNKTFEIGTAVKITTVLSVDSPTICTITIKDPANITKVNAVSMNGESTNIYSYVYQSSTADLDGDYKIFIDATYGAYNSRAYSTFTLIDNDP